MKIRRHERPGIILIRRKPAFLILLVSLIITLALQDCQLRLIFLLFAPR